MYRLERTGLAWILDAPDPSSSFPSLKQHEMKQFGEYRTQRYALRAFDQLERGEVPNLIGSPSGRTLTRPFRSRPVEQRGLELSRFRGRVNTEVFTTSLARVTCPQARYHFLC